MPAAFSASTSSGMPGYGAVLSSLWASYRAVNSASVAVRCSGVRASAGEKRSTSFGMPLPTICLNCSTENVGQPCCAQTQLPASARSSMVFSRVPSKSNKIVFITEKDSFLKTSKALEKAPPLGELAHQRLRGFSKNSKQFCASRHGTLRTVSLARPGKAKVRLVRSTLAAHGDWFAVRQRSGWKTQMLCR